MSFPLPILKPTPCFLHVCLTCFKKRLALLELNIYMCIHLWICKMSLKEAINKLLRYTISSYKGFRIGDIVVNINKKCMHYGSMGEVVRIEELGNNSGYLIHYKVTNDGSTFSPGDVLSKTEDQLSLGSKNE